MLAPRNACLCRRPTQGGCASGELAAHAAASVSGTFAVRCRFAVLNDFEAIGYGVPVVPKEDLLVLHNAPVQLKVLPPPAGRVPALPLPKDRGATCTL